MEGGAASGGVERVVAIRYGTVVADLAHCFTEPARLGDPKDPLRSDYFMWVIWHDGEPIVVDTGFDTDFAHRRGRDCLVEPAAALAALGVEPARVERVVLTHLHYDHIGNLDLFPRAQLLVDGDEIDYWIGEYLAAPGDLDYVRPVELEQVAQADREGRVRRVGAEEEIAPGVTLRRLGGHSPGQQIIELSTAGGPVVLTSDAIHFYREMEHDVPFAIYHDLEAMRRGYEVLRRLEADGATLVPGHDPLVMERFERSGELTVEIV